MLNYSKRQTLYISRDNLANTGYCFKQHSNLLTCFELCKKMTSYVSHTWSTNQLSLYYHEIYC
jgi:hypothetical protein